MSERSDRLPSGTARLMYQRSEIVPAFVIDDQERQHCQGKCGVDGECVGNVRLVRVCGWGWFAYCETAIEKDLSQGFDLFDEHDNDVKTSPHAPPKDQI